MTAQHHPTPHRTTRKNPILLAVSTLLIIASAAAFGGLYLIGQRTTTILIANKPIAQGQQLTADHLTTADISGGPINTIPANQAHTLNGQTATTTIPQGAVLVTNQFTNQPNPTGNHVAVGITTDTGTLPTELTAGRHVDIHAAPNHDQQPPDGTPASIIIVRRAQVHSMTNTTTGTTRLTLILTSDDAAKVTAQRDKLVFALTPLAQG